MILGITGGIGCGKSTATGMLELAGFRRIDTDDLVREQVLKSSDVIAAVRARWAERVIDQQGQIDRGKLAAVVFASDADRNWLEGLVHPRVFALWRERLATDPQGRWVIEVPLLHEKQLENWFDFTICVASAPETQLARLEQRGLPRPLAAQRISKQLPLAHKIEHSDFVLWNDGPVEFLQKQIDRLITVLPKAG
jgi:dephospho-CoA kinase